MAARSLPMRKLCEEVLSVDLLCARNRSVVVTIELIVEIEGLVVNEVTVVTHRRQIKPNLSQYCSLVRLYFVSLMHFSFLGRLYIFSTLS